VNFAPQVYAHHNGIEVARVVASHNKSAFDVGSPRKKTRSHRVAKNIAEELPAERVKHVVEWKYYAVR
jgi:hypothetical protein